MIFSLQTDNDFLTIILFDHHFYDIFTSFGYTYIYLWNYKKFEHHLFSSDWHTHVRAIIITLKSDLLIVKTIIVVKSKRCIKCGFLYRNIIRSVITTTRIHKLKILIKYFTFLFCQLACIMARCQLKGIIQMQSSTPPFKPLGVTLIICVTLAYEKY